MHFPAQPFHFPPPLLPFLLSPFPLICKVIGCTDSLSFLNYCPAQSIFLHPAVGSRDLRGQRARLGRWLWEGTPGSWALGGFPAAQQKRGARTGRDRACLPRSVPGSVPQGPRGTHGASPQGPPYATSHPERQMHEQLFSLEGSQYFSICCLGSHCRCFFSLGRSRCIC